MQLAVEWTGFPPLRWEARAETRRDTDPAAGICTRTHMHTSTHTHTHTRI